VVDFCRDVIAERSAKIGIQEKYLDGKVYFVDDALAGSVTTREKLEIGLPIISFYSIDVVDRLFREKLASYFLLHDIAVFQNIARWFSTNSRYDETNISPTSFITRDFLVGVVLSVRKSSEQRSTLRAAQRFESIDGSSGTPLYGHGVSALYAEHRPLFIGQATSNAAAFSRAVLGIFAEFFSVLGQVSRFVEKRLAADFTEKRGGLGLRGRASVYGFVRSFARSAAKSLIGVRGFDLKSGQALFTLFIDRHFVLSSFVATSVDSTSVCLSK
jgi:hypothetical protein